MRILITNDDGITAPGLAALVRVARDFGEPVVVAPCICHSAGSHAVSMNRAIEIHPANPIGGATAYACGGTPADCVRIGLHVLPLGSIDCVLAGINPGANLGVDVFYSGTVAAAREGALLGVSSVAVSQLVRGKAELKWPAIERRARVGLETIFNLGQDRPRLLNLNLPAPPDGGLGGGPCWSHLSLATWPMIYERRPSDDGIITENVGNYLERADDGGDFSSVVRHHAITVTPLQLDTTDHAALEEYDEKPCANR